MTKKTVKLMMAISLTTVFGVSAFMESAEAQRRTGNTYSQTGEDEQNVQAQFSLVNATREGIPIDDAEGGNDSIGLFIGAIENYSPAKGEICFNSFQEGCDPGFNISRFHESSRYLYNSSGFPIFMREMPLMARGIPFDGNLLAELVEPGIEQYSPSRTTTDAIIAYSIFRRDKRVSRYRLFNLASVDIAQAVNSLEYILDNNLLGLTQTVRDDIDTGSDQRIILSGGDVLVQNQFEQDIPTTPVPEPDTTIASLLGIGVLGAGSLLKRKVKHS